MTIAAPNRIKIGRITMEARLIVRELMLLNSEARSPIAAIPIPTKTIKARKFNSSSSVQWDIHIIPTAPKKSTA